MTTAYAAVPFHLTYDFFHFIRPMSGTNAKLAYGLFCTASVLASLGIWFRPAMFVTAIGLTYSFLVDQTLFNNHYYLFILIAFLLVTTDAARGISIYHPFTTAIIPMRQVWMFRFMVCLVYFYGGINKINYDWLHYAEPVYTWLPKMVGNWVLNTPPSTYKSLAFFLAYAGLLLDLLSGIFLLFENRLKYVLLPVLLLFHILNGLFFNIGYFPYFSVAALLLFLPPSWLKEKLSFLFTKQTKEEVKHAGLANSALLLFVVLQMLLPLRHWLIPGNYLWHERGILFSWTMKLRDKQPIINLTYKVAGDPHIYEFPIHKYTGLRQLKHLGYRPLDLVQFAHYMEDEVLKPQYNGRDIQVYAEIFTCLNHYRPFQLLVNPYVDLTTIDIKNKISIQNYDWIVPLGEDHFGLQPPKEIIEQSQHYNPESVE